MVEAQAIGRVHRHGQAKPVKIFRYIMQGTIEEVGPSLIEMRTLLDTNTCIAL
jgi:SNF2 family DNA or RNA helicase